MQILADTGCYADLTLPSAPSRAQVAKINSLVDREIIEALKAGALDYVVKPFDVEELKIIEGWLQMSLHLMQLSIKTMELQKASLEAMRGSMGGAQK